MKFLINPTFFLLSAYTFLVMNSCADTFTSNYSDKIIGKWNCTSIIENGMDQFDDDEDQVVTIYFHEDNTFDLILTWQPGDGIFTTHNIGTYLVNDTNNTIRMEADGDVIVGDLFFEDNFNTIKMNTSSNATHSMISYIEAERN